MSRGESLEKQNLAKLRNQIALIMRDRNLSSTQRAVQREELIRLAANYSGNENVKKLLKENARQHDAIELLDVLLDAGYGDNSKLFEQRYDVADGRVLGGKQRINCHKVELGEEGAETMFAALLGESQKEKVTDTGARHRSAITCSNDATELCFSLKRFETAERVERGEKKDYKAKKLRRKVGLDPIKLTCEDGSERDFSPTAFIIHRGETTNSGHYYSYIKEVDGWHCYDDSERSDTISEGEISAILARGAAPGADGRDDGEVYVVKYSHESAKLPAAQKGTPNGGCGRNQGCWANAAMSFMASFTSLGLEVEREVEKERDEKRTQTPGTDAADLHRTPTPPAPSPAPVTVKPVTKKKHEPLPSKKISFAQEELKDVVTKIEGGEVFVKFRNSDKEEKLQKDDSLWKLDVSGQIVIDVAEYKNQIFKYYDNKDAAVPTGALKQLISVIPQSALREVRNSREP